MKEEIKMKKMKKFSVVIVLLVACLVMWFAPSAKSQPLPTYSQTLVSMTLTNIAAASVSNLFNLGLMPTFFVGKQGNVGFQFAYSTSTNSGGVEYKLCTSVDGVSWDTNRLKTVTIPSADIIAANFTNIFVTNYSCAGIGYFGIYSVSNNHSVALWTNLPAKTFWGLKIGAP